MMKIKFVAYWNTDYNIYSFMKDIWDKDGLYEDILTYENDYTHLVIMNKVDLSNYRIDKEKTYGIPIEPYWSNSFDKNMLSYCHKVITYQPEFYDESKTIFAPLIGMHRLYQTEYRGEPNPLIGTTNEILNTDFEKTKKLSIIVGYHSDAYYHYSNESLYNKRHDLVRKLLDSDLEFDMFGQDWPINDYRYKGFLKNKIDGLKNYEFSICLENSSIGGHISEKFIDAILCNTIPIYNGHRDIFKYYPNSCEYLDYDGNEIENIKHILNNGKTFKNYSFLENKNIYLNIYNPIKIIIEDILKQNK
jgi:hypothetical protein